MWSKLKEVVTGLAEQAGIEVPELPVDLSSVTEAVAPVTDAVAPLTEAVAPVTDAVAPLAESAAGLAQGAGGAVVDAVAETPIADALPDLPTT